MTEQVSIYLTAMILGIMLFFSFVIAPVVFTTLDEDNARKFIRRIFPFYYNVNLGISLIVLLTFILLSKLGIDFYLILAICALFATSNYLLMPLINKYRDEKQDKKFKYSHFISVAINFVQIIFWFAGSCFCSKGPKEPKPTTPQIDLPHWSGFFVSSSNPKKG